MVYGSSIGNSMGGVGMSRQPHFRPRICPGTHFRLGRSRSTVRFKSKQNKWGVLLAEGSLQSPHGEALPPSVGDIIFVVIIAL